MGRTCFQVGNYRDIWIQLLGSGEDERVEAGAPWHDAAMVLSGYAEEASCRLRDREVLADWLAGRVKAISIVFGQVPTNDPDLRVVRSLGEFFYLRLAIIALQPELLMRYGLQAFIDQAQGNIPVAEGPEIGLAGFMRIVGA